MNLIGGQNNAGKTALLEALAIAAYPEPFTIELFRRTRDFRTYNIETDTDNVWDHFFWELNKSSIIKIHTEFPEGESNDTIVQCVNNIGDLKDDLLEMASLKSNEVFREIGSNTNCNYKIAQSYFIILQWLMPI